MASIAKPPPDADELEVTLLGRGVGESCVVHLGEKRWMIVDSFNTNAGAAALQYLDIIQVSPDAVEHIVVTHFDADHYRGIDDIHDECQNAFLHFTEALDEEEFLKLHVDQEDPSFLGELPGVIERAKERRIDGTPAWQTLKVGVPVTRDPVEVRAISPTRDAITVSVNRIANSMATRKRANVNNALRRENRASVGLHINAETLYGCSVLLAADIETSPKKYGWDAILRDPHNRGLPATSLTKVAHHGSHHNHCQAAWDTLSTTEPMLLAAPYWSSGLPKETDIDRLKSIGDLYVAAPRAKWRDMPDGHKVAVDIEVGIIQARRRLDEGKWRIGHRAPAFKA